MRDSINRAAERIQDKRLACAVQAASWDGINANRAAIYRCMEDTYQDAYRILREETDLHPRRPSPTTSPTTVASTTTTASERNTRCVPSRN